jgi:hypothetical protein
MNHYRGALAADGFGAFQPAFGRAQFGPGALHGEALEAFAVLDAQLQPGGPAKGHSGVVEPLARNDRINQFDDGVSQFRDVERFRRRRRDAVAGQVPGDDVEVVAEQAAGLCPQH